MMKIRVKSPTGDIIPLELGTTDTIQDVKKQIESTYGVPTDQQKLVLSGAELKDAQTSSECKLEDESELQLLTTVSMVIYIKLLNEQVVPLALSPLDTVMTMKMRLVSTMAAGTPLLAHDVYYEDTLLDNDRSLASYDIPARATLCIKDTHFREFNLVMFQGQTIKIKLNCYNEKERLLHVVGSHIVANCGMVPDMDELAICRGEDVLDPFKPVEDCEIADGSTLCLKLYKNKTSDVNESPEFPVQISYLDYPHINVNVESTKVVKDLKQDLEKLIELAPSRMVIYYDKIRLLDDELLGVYNIKAGCVLRVEEICRLHVVSPDGDSVKIACRPSRTVKQVKEGLESLTGIDTAHLILYHDDVEMLDDATMAQYAVTNGEVLLRSDVRVFIHLKIPDYKSVFIRAKLRDTITSVKIAIEEKTGVAERVQTLYLGEEELDDANDAQLFNYTTALNVTLRMEHEPMHIRVYFRDLPSREYGPFSVLDTASNTLSKIAQKIELLAPHRVKLRVSGLPAIDNKRWVDMGFVGGYYDANLAWCARYEFDEPPAVTVENQEEELETGQLLPESLVD